MNNHFLEIFHQNLIKEEFSPINFSFNSKNIVCFIKQFGSNIYFICPVKDNIINYKDIFTYCENYINNNILNQYVNKIFFLEILISDNIKNESIQYITYNSNLDDKVISLKWLIDISNNQIIVKGNQANELLNISKIIKLSFNSDFNNKSIYETIEEENLNKVKSLKSKNIYFTISLIIILCFIYFYAISKNLHTKFLKLGSTSPNMFAEKQYYRIFTSAFLHSNISHLSSNCLSLYIFGSRVERYMGKVNFFIIYSIGIISSSLASYFFNKSYSIGASGAIFALEGAILYYSIKNKTKIDGLDFFIFIMFSILGISTGFIYNNVDNAGHIGGFVSGIIVSYLLCLNINKNIKNNLSNNKK